MNLFDWASTRDATDHSPEAAGPSDRSGSQTPMKHRLEPGRAGVMLLPSSSGCTILDAALHPLGSDTDIPPSELHTCRPAVSRIEKVIGGTSPDRAGVIIMPAVPGCANFDAALQYLASDASAPVVKLRVWRTAVSKLGKVTGRTAVELPVAPELLVPLLCKVMPAAHKMTIKHWSNTRSALTAIARAVGHHGLKPSTYEFTTAAWPALLDQFDNEAWKAALRNFAAFCDHSRIQPVEVTEAVIERYRDWRTTCTYDRKPGDTMVVVRNAWNRYFVPVLGGQTRRLAAPRDPRVQALPMTAFPESFCHGLDAYLENLRRPDPFDHLRSRPLASITIVERRRFLIRGASIAVEEGVPPEEITGLETLTTPRVMRIILLALHRRAGGRWTGGAVQMAAYLMDVAKRWLRLDSDALDPLLCLRRMVRVEHRGIGEQSRRRLGQFNDPRVLEALWKLPGELFLKAEGIKAEQPTQAARIHERGLALGLLLVLPMRRRNLEALDLDRHFERDDKHRIVRLCIPATEVKNRIEISSDMPRGLALQMDRHIRLFRPTLKGSELSSFLFHGPCGRQRAMGTLAKVLASTVREALGVEFHIHLIRHIAADLLYDEHPENGPVVQRLLGHTELKTTETVYGVRTTRRAQRLWAEIVDRKLAVLQRKNRR